MKPTDRCMYLSSVTENRVAIRCKLARGHEGACFFEDTVAPFPISPTELQRAQSTMGLIGRVAAGVDWSAYVETVDRAETIAPFVDPTAYIRSPHELRHETTELARLLARVVKQWEKCSAELDRAIEREGTPE